MKKNVFQLKSGEGSERNISGKGTSPCNLERTEENLLTQKAKPSNKVRPIDDTKVKSQEQSFYAPIPSKFLS